MADAAAPVRPAFPQLKLPADGQPGAVAPERLRLQAIYLLPTALEEVVGGGVEIAPLAPGEALAALLRHTVATRLFTADLLRAHLGACGALAERVPVRRSGCRCAGRRCPKPVAGSANSTRRSGGVDRFPGPGAAAGWRRIRNLSLIN